MTNPQTTQFDAASHQESTIDLSCAGCGYALRGLPQTASCPECSFPIARSMITETERVLLKREDRVLRRMDSYRRNRSAAAALGIINLLGYFGCFWIGSISPEPAVVFATVSAIPFWFAIAFANHARLQHAQSILFYRNRKAKA